MAKSDLEPLTNQQAIEIFDTTQRGVQEFLKDFPDDLPVDYERQDLEDLRSSNQEKQ